MPNINIFLDGSWLFKVCGPGHVLAGRTENPNSSIRIDFAKLDQTLLTHVGTNQPECGNLGTRYLATSVFTLPDDLDTWPDSLDDILPDHIEMTRRNIAARNRFVQSAI